MDYKYTGIILGKVDIGETDRIYTAYTLEAGKIRAIAQGVKKSQAKLAGHLENFILTDLTVIKKRGMGRITGSIAENNFSQIRNDLSALEKVFRAINIFNRLIVMEEKDERVFNVLKEFLEALDKTVLEKNNSIDILFYGFLFKLFDLLGYKIEAGLCVSCASPLSEKENYFNAELGGMLCQKCSPEFSGKIKINKNTIKVIRIFGKNRLISLAKLRINKEELRDLESISNDFLGWIAN